MLAALRDTDNVKREIDIHEHIFQNAPPVDLSLGKQNFIFGLGNDRRGPRVLDRSNGGTGSVESYREQFFDKGILSQRLRRAGVAFADKFFH